MNSLDEMNINSANALLKILEEPQKNSLFFIISHSKGDSNTYYKVKMFKSAI